jgi:hypothetical protein
MNRIPASLAALALAAAALCTPLHAQEHAAEPAKLPEGMTGPSTTDPRSTLKPGFYDAGEAALGMAHVAYLKKPSAFLITGTTVSDPMVQKGLGSLGIPPEAKMPDAMKLVYAGLAFANSDFAFQGNHLFQGNFYGASIYDISDPAKAKLLTTLVCPGGQGDVSVYGHLLFYSVEMPNGRLDCGAQAFPPNPPPAKDDKHPDTRPAASPERFRGVRIFDISDILKPRQVAAIQTCRGSHTHTLVTDPKDPANVYIYVSGTSFVRQSDELAGCSSATPDKDPNTSLFSIDVIKVPVAHPELAKIVSSPRVFMDPRSGALAGLSNAGTHGGGKTQPTDQCHDITVYSAIGLAAGACSGNGLLLDIHNPEHPVRLDAVNDPNYAYWHSASFSNDGSKVVFTDEWGGGMGARCRATDPLQWGADAIFQLKDKKLAFDSYYKIPDSQGDSENCVAHNGSLVPIPGRDIEVQAWYQGGVSVMDFTDPHHAFEIAYFDRGPIDPKTLILGGMWSAYWYNGFIYGSEISRGLDIFKLTPTANLTENEIAAANQIHFAELNVQNQQKLTWPPTLLTARAYLDQLTRSEALPADELASLKKALATPTLSASAKVKLKTFAAKVTAAVPTAKTPADADRLTALAAILSNPKA